MLAYVVGGEVRGVAELCPFAPPYADEGEAAFSVETPYRLRGAGHRFSSGLSWHPHPPCALPAA